MRITLLWAVPVILCAAACSAEVNVFGRGGNGGGGGETTGGAPGVGGEGATSPSGPTTSSMNSSTTSTTNVVNSASTGSSCMPGPNTDLDGDGFSPAEGDCDDCDAALSPNNLDVPGNLVDDDCDGAFDNALEPCDEGLTIDEDDPLVAASAIELCRISSGPGHWGLATAQWVLADGTPPPSAPPTLAQFHLGHGLLQDFGAVVEPRAGARLLALSNGTARDAGDPGFEDPQGGSKGYTSGFPPGAPKPSAGCPGASSGTPNDPIALEMVVRVPDNAQGFSFDSNFYAFDFPSFVCSSFDDTFFALMTPSPPGLVDGQIAFYGNGDPVSLNGAQFDVCSCPSPPCMAGGKSYACTQGDSALVGTGYETHAATGWQTTTVPVPPGEEITLRLGVYDAGDPVFGATALLDAFTWHTGAVTVETIATP